MANFCGSCGAAIHAESPFCGSCGSPVRRPAAGPSAPPSAAGMAPAQNSYAPAAIPQKSSNAIKIVFGLLGLLFVGVVLAIGGVYYAAHKVSQKAHELSSRVLHHASSDSGSLASLLRSASTANENTRPISGDACNLLGKSVVSHAIGVPIVATGAADGGCQYLAKGTAAEMTAKHMASLLGRKGADPQQQQIIEKLSGGLFSSFESGASRPSSYESEGNVVVLAFTVQENTGTTEMGLNRKVLSGLGPGSQNVSGVGDEAFDVAGAMMMVRKGDRIVRITYTSCPCTLDAIKPLAQKIADAI